MQLRLELPGPGWLWTDATKLKILFPGIFMQL